MPKTPNSAAARFLRKPGSKTRLASIDPASTPGIDKLRAEAELARNREELEKLQYRLWAQNTQALLVVLQGMDTSGKDGVVRQVVTGMNPEGSRVTSFKKPSEVELDHDFLWRIHSACPARGEVAVFNRSHYEDVLIVRVHALVPKEVWRPRYEIINGFERTLVGDGTTIVKIFLHISKDEQKRRLIERLEDPEKNWKFNPGDVEERKHWDEYQEAYEDVISRCGTPEAPWHVVPADHKWYRNWAVSEILLHAMREMAPKPPRGRFKVKDFKFDE
ncbi:MAG: polyphosphate kinase 2 family protein [Planctomycetota bacterium]